VLARFVGVSWVGEAGNLRCSRRVPVVGLEQFVVHASATESRSVGSFGVTMGNS